MANTQGEAQRGAAPTTEPRIHLLADLHLSASRNQNREIEEGLLELRAKSAKADALAIAGDLTDDATSGQFAEAERLLKIWDLGPVCLAPGNHDGARIGLFWVGFAGWNRLCRRLGVLESTQVGRRLVIGVDSTLHTFWPGDLARGEVGGRQLRRIRSEVGRAIVLGFDRSDIVLLMHHDPFSRNETEALNDAPAFLALVSELGVICVCGHTHGSGYDWSVGQVGGRVINLRSGLKGLVTL